MKMMSPHIEVVLMKVMLGWNRSWTWWLSYAQGFHSPRHRHPTVLLRWYPAYEHSVTRIIFIGSESLIKAILRSSEQGLLFDVNTVRSALWRLHATWSQKLKGGRCGPTERPGPYCHWSLYNLHVSSPDDDCLSAWTNPFASTTNRARVIFYHETDRR